MKLLTSEFREHLLRRSKDEERKHIRRRYAKKHTHALRVILQGNLDLITNEVATRVQLLQFDDVFAKASRRESMVFINMREVTDIDACALLHIVAHLDRIKTLHKVKLEGNYPRSSRALLALYDAGFERFIGIASRIKARRSTEPLLRITKGNAASRLTPMAWLPLHDFLHVHGHLNDEEADTLYAAFGECVENVRQHAYKQNRSGMWYALAIRPAADRPARMVVLDFGIGISRSVRRRKVDRMMDNMRTFVVTVLAGIRELLHVEGDDTDEATIINAAIQRLRKEDWMCVYFATLGLRTETSEQQRGTGLSGLRQAVIKIGRGAMHVLSGEASIRWARDHQPVGNELPRLRGTTVCLELGAWGYADVVT